MRKGQRFLFCLEVRVFSEVEGGFESFGNFLKKKKKEKCPSPLHNEKRTFPKNELQLYPLHNSKGETVITLSCKMCYIFMVGSIITFSVNLYYIYG